MTNEITVVNELPTFEEVANAIVEFAKQKPGFELCNYGSMASYKSDYNRYKKDADFNRNFSKGEIVDMLRLLTKVQYEYILRTGKRLSYNKERQAMDYICGQYFPTEYQSALRRMIEEIKFKIENNKREFSEIREVKPFRTGGEFVAITLHTNPENEIFAIVCPDWEDNTNAILEFSNGDAMKVPYSYIKWKRDLLPSEK
ncbi:hypothetical protein [Bacillus thuringiensis]|uniref:hypothetical protein n=1 Tax=Bacillus thuringiensis TaxID=1428 RepID=UPI000BF67343|nr:hypothetical protein [Bacillus thuringiensis]PFC28577.1 hypothetical protein CN299_20110 [Bacillus thuringiensis]